jgi:hypothetical protein
MSKVFVLKSRPTPTTRKRESTTPVIAVETELVDTTGCRTVLDESNVRKKKMVSSVRISITPSSTETVAKEQLLLQLRRIKKPYFQSFQ